MFFFFFSAALVANKVIIKKPNGGRKSSYLFITYKQRKKQTINVFVSNGIPGVSTKSSSKKVPSNDCNNDRQPEIAIWSPKPEILIFGWMMNSL